MTEQQNRACEHGREPLSFCEQCDAVIGTREDPRSEEQVTLQESQGWWWTLGAEGRARVTLSNDTPHGLVLESVKSAAIDELRIRLVHVAPEGALGQFTRHVETATNELAKSLAGVKSAMTAVDSYAGPINEALQAASELVRAVGTFSGNVLELEPKLDMLQELEALRSNAELLRGAAAEWLRAFSALESFNGCCGSSGTHSEGGREFCSTCGTEAPAKRWV